eukprot:7376912-Prymnesium_polylepis.1
MQPPSLGTPRSGHVGRATPSSRQRGADALRACARCGVRVLLHKHLTIYRGGEKGPQGSGTKT